MKFQIIIPARYESSRFPGKPLAKICGVSMIERVYRQAQKVIDNVCVATDDQRIVDAVESFGGKAVMTSNQHRSGTDRINEAYKNINSDADVVINIQGDEPFIQPEQIKLLMDCFNDDSVQIATLAHKIKSTDDIFDPNLVKVVFSDSTSNALYFSRYAIPFMRGVDCENWVAKHDYYAHIGMYAYRADVLQKITSMPQSTLEKVESLEQLRWLEAGLPIKVGITDFSTIGVDTPNDLLQAELYLKEHGE